VANTRFEVDPSYPRNKCSFLDSGWFWKIEITRGTFGKFFLVDGAGLAGFSNNFMVVPNSDAGFIGKDGAQQKRPVELYGLTAGITLCPSPRPAPRTPP